MSVRFRFVNMFDSSRQHLVADECQKYSTRSAPADEARAEDHVGLAVEDRLRSASGTRRVVLEVGVLHDHDVAGRRARSPVRRAAPLPWFSS